MRKPRSDPTKIVLFAPVDAVGLVQRLLMILIALLRECETIRSVNEFRYWAGILRGGGKFPFWEVYRVIEGRGVVPGHGSRDMPVWGDRFRADARDAGLSRERGRSAASQKEQIFFIERAR